MEHEQMSTTDFVRWILDNIGQFELCTFTDWAVRAKIEAISFKHIQDLLESTFGAHVIIGVVWDHKNHFDEDIYVVGITYRR